MISYHWGDYHSRTMIQPCQWGPSWISQCTPAALDRLWLPSQALFHRTCYFREREPQMFTHLPPWNDNQQLFTPGIAMPLGQQQRVWSQSSKASRCLDVLAQVVGSITYSSQSHYSAGWGSNLGWKLFAEYAGMMQMGLHGPQGSNPQCSQSLQAAGMHTQPGLQIAMQADMQGVHISHLLCIAYIDSHIVRPADSHANGHADSCAGRQAQCMLLTPILKGHIDLHIGRPAECCTSQPAGCYASAHTWSGATGSASIHGITVCNNTGCYCSNHGSDRSGWHELHSVWKSLASHKEVLLAHNQKCCKWPTNTCHQGAEGGIQKLYSAGTLHAQGMPEYDMFH